MSRKDVAKLAGVSEATVSRVMNNVGPIKKETREKVLRAAEQLGYELNALAQQLARQKSGNLGVVLPHVPKVHLFSTYYFSEILSGIAEVARKQNIDLLMVFQDPAKQRDYTKLFRSKKIDSCIILGSTDSEEERTALQELTDHSYPFVIINQRYAGMPFRFVDGDHVYGSYLAVSHLLEQGSKRVALLNGPKQYSNSIDRYNGYLKALHERDIHCQEQWLVEGNYSRRSGMNAAKKLAGLIEAGEIDSIFAANDRMAIGAMEGLAAHQLEAGKHYRIIGYDDSDGAKIVTPKLSSISVPFYEMGVKAATMLLDDKHREESHAIMPVSLVIRQSSI
ncbi:LacI family transcriptional regulator [Paenibacillus montaniterrae]|uniref:LacI family transcriptional regulator n=1 Tax=Paenibacillus montaniterrae TaxID=429341 RepID=A0A919YQ15_9BACL|nr:LacI family DNA-binding transcriptional regulator [Paenibacillus montaniterrae]GIP17202.1 LacI family transcriptional regulator [Paenibacillus montaniterrae]